jgi:pimeloyl-ACP methyl ester carboxylesterase
MPRTQIFPDRSDNYRSSITDQQNRQLFSTRRISAPTVVIHGSQDPMVRPRNGRNVARVIDGARYVVVDGMGHDLPEPVWRPVAEALTENMAAAR